MDKKRILKKAIQGNVSQGNLKRGLEGKEPEKLIFLNEDGEGWKRNDDSKDPLMNEAEFKAESDRLQREGFDVVAIRIEHTLIRHFGDEGIKFRDINETA